MLQALCLSITYGYFIYDTIGVYLIEHDWTNSVHHIASVLAFTIGIFQRISGSELAWSLFLMEVSNPLLHLRSYFKVRPCLKAFLSSNPAICFCSSSMPSESALSHYLVKLVLAG